MTEKEIKDVSNIALVLEIDGIIVSNTTVSRPSGIEGTSDETDSLRWRLTCFR